MSNLMYEIFKTMMFCFGTVVVFVALVLMASFIIELFKPIISNIGRLFLGSVCEFREIIKRR